MHPSQKKKNLADKNRTNLKFTPEILVKLEKGGNMEETKFYLKLSIKQNPRKAGQKTV